MKKGIADLKNPTPCSKTLCYEPSTLARQALLASPPLDITLSTKDPRSGVLALLLHAARDERHRVDHGRSFDGVRAIGLILVVLVVFVVLSVVLVLVLLLHDRLNLGCCALDGDWVTADVLVVHLLEGAEVVVSVGEAHEAVALALGRFLVADDAGLDERGVLGECLVQRLVSYLTSEVTNEQPRVHGVPLE
jgi:hypothetical protein